MCRYFSLAMLADQITLGFGYSLLLLFHISGVTFNLYHSSAIFETWIKKPCYEERTIFLPASHQKTGQMTYPRSAQELACLCQPHIQHQQIHHRNHSVCLHCSWSGLGWDQLEGQLHSQWEGEEWVGGCVGGEAVGRVEAPNECVEFLGKHMHVTWGTCPPVNVDPFEGNGCHWEMA